MKLSQLLNVKSNVEKIFEAKSIELLVFFQEFMWNGYDDENDPKFVSKEDFEAIEALVDKMEHMTFHIGCPNSIEPMLFSIANRKIKHWQATDNVETDDKTEYVFDDELKSGKTVIRSKGFKQGKQLKSKGDLHKVRSTDGYYHIDVEKRVLTGHFRWNWKGYTLSRVATDVLKNYLDTKF